MKQLLIVFCAIAFSISCRYSVGKRVNGNGNLTTETRDVSSSSKIKVKGSIDVELVPGDFMVKVEADENLLQYILTEKEDGWLVIRQKNNVNIKTKNRLKVYVSLNEIDAIDISGSGDVKGIGKFKGGDRVNIDIAGSGDIELDVNTPKVNVDIAGSGTASLSGETKDANVEIAGSGNYRAEELMTESTSIDIIGSGDARVFADINLKAKVIGSGSVYYKGKANVRSNITGSGTVKPID
jgi:hypothetical protein